MTQCNHDTMKFASCRRRRVRVDFSGGSISSNGGALLLREVDRKLGLTDRVARALGDRRQRAKVRHEVVTMVRQRVHAVASGYEDLNDHDALRHDEVMQTACERDESLASSSTLCRFERRAERQWAVAIHQVLVEQFIASHRRAPRELVIDFDATDDPVHGHQHGAVLSRVLRPVLLFAAVRVLRPPATGRVPSPVEPRCGAPHVGDIVVAGQAASPSVAGGAHRAAGGLGVLPAPDARLVRAPSGGVPRGAGPQWGTRTQGRGGVRGGRAWLPGDREEVPGVHRSAVWRGRLAPAPAGHRRTDPRGGTRASS